jgi:aryl-alcohol dehydrogenase-like predicted oxidoreductase
MQYRALGSTGIKVSTLALGAMNFGAFGNPDHDDSVRIVHAALDAGINLVDTADVYSVGESEEIIGKALEGRRDSVVLATKAGNPMSDDPNETGSSRRWLTRSVESSLRRLRTDRIDLFQVHRPDWDTSDEETLSALTDLQRAGKILHFGSSTFPAHRIVTGRWVAAEKALSPYVTEQPSYSILMRGIEANVLPVAREYSMGVIVWSPLGAGWLTGAVTRDGAATNRAKALPGMFDAGKPGNQAKFDAVDKLTVIAHDADLTLIQLALGFATAHTAVTSAIVGPRTMAHLESQLAAQDVHLSEETLDRIDEVVAPGTDLAPDDRFETPVPDLTDARLRRRG